VARREVQLQGARDGVRIEVTVSARDASPVLLGADLVDVGLTQRPAARVGDRELAIDGIGRTGRRDLLQGRLANAL
jgi:hypothetical protein